MKAFNQSRLRVWLRNLFILQGLMQLQEDDFMKLALESAMRYSARMLILEGGRNDEERA